MIEYISRRDICKKLEINDYVLREYENFLELPEPPDGDAYDVSIAKLIGKLHELVQSGYNYSDIKYLSLCAERFADVVPALNSFKDLSPQYHLRELVKYYNGLIGELAEREVHYQERIRELESYCEEVQVELEKGAIAREHLNLSNTERESLLQELEAKNLDYSNLQMKSHELEVGLQQAEFTITEYKDEIEKLRVELDYYTNANQDVNLPKRSAVDIQALLKKKEKEVSLKYQREIFDLKKQVDMMVEQKEEQWNFMTRKTS